VASRVPIPGPERPSAALKTGSGAPSTAISVQSDRAWFGYVLSHPSKARIHPTDEDLSVGTKGDGAPLFVRDRRRSGHHSP
jgi:hypothetical protein